MPVLFGASGWSSSFPSRSDRQWRAQRPRGAPASPGAQIRRIFIDNSTSPVTFWAGNNHHAAILKIEPLD
jgi:hypothetical protein